MTLTERIARGPLRPGELPVSDRETTRETLAKNRDAADTRPAWVRNTIDTRGPIRATKELTR